MQLTARKSDEVRGKDGKQSLQITLTISNSKSRGPTNGLNNEREGKPMNIKDRKRGGKKGTFLN